MYYDYRKKQCEKEDDTQKDEYTFERSVDLRSARVALTAGNNGRYELYYQLIETFRIPDSLLEKDNAGQIGGSCYSLMILEYIGGVCEDSSFAYDVTDEKGKALEIFELLVNETVTPCTLTDILEDIL